MSQLIKKLKEMVTAAGFETTYAIYLKNAIKVGETSTGDVLCVSVHRNENPVWEYDELYLDIIFNKHESKTYGFDYDFTAVRYLEVDKGKPSFLPKKLHDEYLTEHPEIKMMPNALELAYLELEMNGQAWIDYQRELRIKSRAFLRMAVGPENKKPKFTWEQRIESLQVSGEINFLMYRRERNHDFETIEQMKSMGQKKWDAQQKKDSALVRKILSEMKRDGEI